MSLVRTVDATVEPVTLGELREHLRLSTTSEDTMLGIYITAARQSAEVFTRRAFLNQVWQLKLDAFPCGGAWHQLPRGRFAGRVIELPKSPVSAVASVTYLDEDGDSQTLASSKYDLDLASLPPRIVLKATESWPEVADAPGAVTITFTAGYGAAATALPKTLKVAVLQLAAHWFENRVPVNIGNIVNELPMHVESLLYSERVMGITPAS